MGTWVYISDEERAHLRAVSGEPHLEFGTDRSTQDVIRDLATRPGLTEEEAESVGQYVEDVLADLPYPPGPSDPIRTGATKLASPRGEG